MSALALLAAPASADAGLRLFEIVGDAYEPELRTGKRLPATAVSQIVWLLGRDASLKIDCFVRGWDGDRWQDFSADLSGLNRTYRYAQGKKVSASYADAVSDYLRGRRDEIVEALKVHVAQWQRQIDAAADAVALLADGPAPHRHLVADPVADFGLRDPRILRPCPFCGEREHLTIEEGTFERVGVRDGKVHELLWNKKQTRILNAEYADTICCRVCDAMAALDCWNHTRPASDYALLRDFDPPAETTMQASAA